MDKIFLEQVRHYIEIQKDEKEIFDYIYRAIIMFGVGKLTMEFNDFVKESINNEDVFNRMIYFLGCKFNVSVISFSLPSIRYQVLKSFNRHNELYYMSLLVSNDE